VKTLGKKEEQKIMSKESWDYSLFWFEAMKQLKEDISPQEYTMWLNNISYHSSDEKNIIVEVPSSFYRDQIKQRYISKIENKLHELSGDTIKVDFVINKKNPIPEKKQNNQETKKPKRKRTHPQLKPEYTFENFVIGENSSFAANAAYSISKNPGRNYNPCLIYGGVGLGKTHLIQSIGNSAYREFDDMKVVYVTAETFTNEFIQSVKENKTHQFKNKYRNVDILLIDDIHFLQNKKETQEELFHTFNALYDANKHMVFTCDRPVSELKSLSERLKNRFERGLNVDLVPPNFETRMAILKKKIEQLRINIPEEVIELICNNVTSNVRDLEAALTKLIAYSELVNKNITVEIAQQQLRDVFSNLKQSNITIDHIQKVVADYFSLSPSDLKGKKKTKIIAFPRQIAMYITREITELSTTEVGIEFGGRDHTTVMYACQRMENRMRTDPTLEPLIQQLIRSIKDSNTRS